MPIKGVFAKYLTWTYLKTARTKVESGVDQFSENYQFWQHLKALRTILARSLVKQSTPMNDVKLGIASYFLDGGLELINVFLSYYFKVERKRSECHLIMKKTIEHLKVNFFLDFMQFFH